MKDLACELKNDCLFYRKPTYNTYETNFYVEHCQKRGEGCGLKRNYDISERLKKKNEKKRNV